MGVTAVTKTSAQTRPFTGVWQHELGTFTVPWLSREECAVQQLDRKTGNIEVPVLIWDSAEPFCCA